MPENDKQKHKTPAVVWLKVTDFMHGWIKHELGGLLKIKNEHIISILHLPGIKDIMRKESVVERTCPSPVTNSISASWKNCIDSGMEFDRPATESTYGFCKASLGLFVPIECPKMCVTESGTLRPWSLNVNFSRKQAAAIQKVLRHEFWKAVEEYDADYSKKMAGKKYPAIDMIEGFCGDTNTPDEYAAAIRREWQRRCKRNDV